MPIDEKNQNKITGDCRRREEFLTLKREMSKKKTMSSWSGPYLSSIDCHAFTMTWKEKSNNDVFNTSLLQSIKQLCQTRKRSLWNWKLEILHLNYSYSLSTSELNKPCNHSSLRKGDILHFCSILLLHF